MFETNFGATKNLRGQCSPWLQACSGVCAIVRKFVYYEIKATSSTNVGVGLGQAGYVYGSQNDA